MTEPTVTSVANPRLKALVALRRRRVREQTGQTVVEGHEELALALAAGVRPHAVYVCAQLFSPAGRAGVQHIGRQAELLDRVRGEGIAVVHLSRPAFEKVAYREGADGLLALVDTVGMPLSALPVDRADPLALLAQGIEKPGNLGAMLRTADAAGADAVVAADPVTDWGNPNVVRASKGTVFAVPVAAAPTDEVLAWARGHDLRLVVTTPEADRLHTEVDYTGRVAVVVGSEKHGVDERMLEAATHRVRIPMRGKANSLNVSVAAAVVLYEALRQRTTR
ncbi:TrmH family RNA methyltransferase [Intrasporangium sp.]|uniref:TrmH family RNA methyltransferase n=1 Tax=Intrasporangium sp. TaxID=1925024 RepID=UPI0032220AC4